MARAKNGVNFKTKFYEFEVVPYYAPRTEYPPIESKIYTKQVGAPATQWKQLTPETIDVLQLDGLGQRILGNI